MDSRRQVAGLFRDIAAAERAVEELIERRFSSDEIGILVADGKDVEPASLEHQSGVGPGAATGGSLGGVLGALGGVLVSIGTLPAGGLGLAAAGPIAAAAGGAVAGTAGGGLLGALAGLGFWTDSPDLPEDLGRGAVLVSAPAAGDRVGLARQVLEDAGAKWVKS